MKYKTLIVLALAQAHTELHDLDADVAGGYIVSFDASGVAPNNLANAALDVFHESVAVKELESFDFYVLDPRQEHKVLEEGDAESYSFHGKGDVEGPHHADWKISTFRVAGKAPGQPEACDLGTVTMGGVDLKEMADCAVGLLWDERLRASGLAPHVERVRDEEFVGEDAATPATRSRG